MTHWDGLSSSHSGTTTPQRILILGATNRIQDIDEAILRRMPKKFPVGLPNASQRHNIFSLILRGTKIDHGHLDLDYLVRMSAGMSGSDIKETCRDAAMVPVREYIRQKKAEGSVGKRGAMQAQEVRGLRTGDFFGQARAARQAKLMEEIDGDVKVGSRGRVVETSDSSAEGEGSRDSSEERFPDSAYQEAAESRR